MNSVFNPLRICKENHIPRQVQFTSGWDQILNDYPNWTYTNSWTESNPPAPVQFEYNDS
jgi:hypothetical protein